jgi:oligoendopeptidase F
MLGYSDYYAYATEKVYIRDYDRAQREALRAYVQTYIAPYIDDVRSMYFGSNGMMPLTDRKALEKVLTLDYDKLPTNYVQLYIDSFDEETQAVFNSLFEKDSSFFVDSSRGYAGAFTTYLYEYEKPICYFGPKYQNCSTMIHEMGHYYASLYNADINSLDLAEVQSQANEMLLLKHLESVMPARVYEVIKNYKLYMCVLEMTVSVIIDEFERAVYDLESVEGFKSADFDAIMDKVCAEYGNFTTLEQNIMDINEYWRLTATNSPVYYISYATSLTEALNVFAEAELDYDNAKEIYRIIIEEVSEDEKFRDAAAMAGLTDPFDKKTFESIIAMILN